MAFSVLIFLLISPILAVGNHNDQNNLQHNTQSVRGYSQQQRCDVPSDFWCDTQELAQRCNVVSQCEVLRRERRPLRISIMYEALCPFCQKFIANNLGLLYNQFKDQIDLELVPWGNAMLRNGQIICNHGPKECDANRMMSCVLDSVSISQAIPFIICFERQLSANSQIELAAQNCAGFMRNTYYTITQCYSGEKGLQLQRQAAYRTMNTKANPIIEVPYILINNYSPKTDSNAINILATTHLIQKWLNQRR